MAEFDESDLRPFTGLQRPITAKPEDDMQSELPGPSRPMTSATRPMTSGRQGPPGSRPMTSMISRPSTGSVPEWMMDDDSLGPDRPKTGYRKPDGSVESRPFSRQGSAIAGADRPYTGRPMTGRAGSAIGRPGSSMANRGIPGTASRLVETAMRNRPASRAGVGLQTAVSVADRPITQQGLTGLKTGSGRGPQRQYQDKSYFLGALRTKMAELTSEINKLSREVESQSEEQSTYLAYDKGVKEIAEKLTISQGVLADYNMLVDKLNTDTERADVEAEEAELRAANEQAAAEVEQLWAEKRGREAQINQLEIELNQEMNMTENLVSAMHPELQDRYMQLKSANMQYARAVEEMNQELDVLGSRKAILEDELSVSALKREAAKLYDQLAAVQSKKEALLSDEKLRGTPQQERERLLEQVKNDNAEISTMERQILEVGDKLRLLQEEREQLEQDMEENQSEKNQKYRELRKREETMDQFLQSFQETRDQELNRIQELELQVASTLENISRNLQHAGHMPSSKAYSSMKEDLAFKEGEVEKSKNTIEGLDREHQQLALNLEKIEALEEKIKTEMSTLKEKMGRMEEEMVTFIDLERFDFVFQS
ncbi:intraflagellar transport protein 74 homolog [Eurytemora carolleeae]|uniref:intraflagellar transport protein 74 homolog n=1 Tax=Eurytemora carolleeae TaxID=1294199 RepID=UPI000C75C9BC|nr:intraflagellar transport protein 74 homolog [Eurytemora carolleeae]|eukprot:XP_023331645.1 intraflagellar transport protein 74 homolog [Eurytemora affinis]